MAQARPTGGRTTPQAARPPKATAKATAPDAKASGAPAGSPKPEPPPEQLCIMPLGFVRCAHLYLDAVPAAIIAQYVNVTMEGVEKDLKVLLPVFANPALVPPPNRAARRGRVKPTPAE